MAARPPRPVPGQLTAMSHSEARRKPGLEDTPGAWLWWFEQGIALLIVALICILVTALNVVSVVSDPEGYWNNIGR